MKAILISLTILVLTACAPSGNRIGQFEPRLNVNGITLPAEPQGSIHDNIGNMREGQGFPDHIYQQPYGNISSPSYGLGFTYRF